MLSSIDSFIPIHKNNAEKKETENTSEIPVSSFFFASFIVLKRFALIVFTPNKSSITFFLLVTCERLLPSLSWLCLFIFRG